MRQLTAEMVDRKLYQQSTNGRKEDDDESGGGEGVQEEGSTQAGEVSVCYDLTARAKCALCIHITILLNVLVAV